MIDKWVSANIEDSFLVTELKHIIRFCLINFYLSLNHINSLNFRMIFEVFF